jgi:hypothetical protein
MNCKNAPHEAEFRDIGRQVVQKCITWSGFPGQRLSGSAKMHQTIANQAFGEHQ